MLVYKNNKKILLYNQILQTHQIKKLVKIQVSNMSAKVS